MEDNGGQTGNFSKEKLVFFIGFYLLSCTVLHLNDITPFFAIRKTTPDRRALTGAGCQSWPRPVRQAGEKRAAETAPKGVTYDTFTL